MEAMHHLTSGMKAVFTQKSIDGIIEVRQSMGGAGYTNWSAIPSYFDDISPTVTFEGDNTVMAQ
jgi:alkylation response protein AidB-like acyl-CoA dehydrogenase